MRIKVFAVDAKGYPGLEWGDEVPPGGFLLGQDGGVEGSGPSRHVNIPWSYWLSKYEITVGQYCEFLNTALVAGRVSRSGQTTVYSITGTNLIEGLDGSFKLIDLGDDQQIRWNVNNFEVVGTRTNYPVAVTWFGAVAWANFYGYDLPTEAEWEKAARGPDFDDQDEHCLYTWGNDKSDAKAKFSGKSTVGYYNGNQTPIGPDMVNGYGCYDMTGNADEWTRTIIEYYDSGWVSISGGISTYPQQEDLSDLRHTYWLGFSYSPIYVTKSGNPIYSRHGVQGTAIGAGFRVCRRYIPEDGTSGD